MMMMMMMPKLSLKNCHVIDMLLNAHW